MVPACGAFIERRIVAVPSHLTNKVDCLIHKYLEQFRLKEVGLHDELLKHQSLIRV